MENAKQPKAVDILVGRNIRMIRVMRGLSQEKLGEALGVTFQQVQKYEKGSNRVSASTLVGISAALCCNVSDLFSGTDQPNVSPVAQPTHTNEAMRVAGDFDKLSPRVKRAVARFVTSLIGADNDDQKIAA